MSFSDGGMTYQAEFAAEADVYEGQHIGNTIQKGNQYTNRTLNFQPVELEDGSTSRVGGVTDNNKNIVMNVDEDTKRNRIHEIFHIFGFSHPKGRKSIFFRLLWVVSLRWVYGSRELVWAYLPNGSTSW